MTLAIEYAARLAEAIILNVRNGINMTKGQEIR